MGELIYFGGREFDRMRTQYRSNVHKGWSSTAARRMSYRGFNPLL
jgi:hypothetical protein